MNTDFSPAALNLTPPALPKGGALQGMPATPGAIGHDGQSAFSLPLPISAGRGHAPSLVLQAQGGSGNGPFGSGWRCDMPAIRRRTSRGVPAYNDQDTFLGPDGEVLVIAQTPDGKPDIRTVTQADIRWQVTAYLAQVIHAPVRTERWQADGQADFWLIHQPDGNVLCLGKSARARIADPEAPDTRIAAWLAEESVTPTGEHAYWHYLSAAELGVSDPAGRDCRSQRYLDYVAYGNATPRATLWLWDGDDAPAQQTWLFTLVMDYGARGTDSATPPPFAIPTGALSPVRQDAFSTYATGFEVRTHLLCRQMLMFHHFPDELKEAATLVSRLLLSYDDNPVLSHLIGAQTLAYEPDDARTLQCLPPLSLEYAPFAPATDAACWQPLSTALGRYHLVDLYGEGLSGLLYQDQGGWFYCPPERDTAADNPDAVSFGQPQPLPIVPALQGAHVNLIDINGDGRLEWLVTQPGGPAGYYRLQADRSWSGFTPLTRLPLEYGHPDALLADLHGGGLPDLAMIGPHSVRLYVNERTGFDNGLSVAQGENINLPVRGRDRQELVALSDMTGSGQSHLVSVRHDSLRYWPALGDGRFGAPVTLSDTLPFDAASFNPRQVYLVDTDGSGAADLVYADAQGIHLFLNQAGNALAAPLTLPWPAGVTFGPLSQLNIADLAGLGTVSLVLTQMAGGPGLSPQSWRYDLSATRPYLLHAVDNNCGARTTLTYRSSAQEWLDEKRDDPAACPGVPFPVLVVSQTQQQDALTGNTLTQTCRYRRGFWDSREREFRGFGYVETRDAQEGQDAIPLRRCSWYHTGREQDPQSLYGTPYVDKAAFPAGEVRLTQWQDEQEVPLDSPDQQTAWWLHRALKGTLLRQESYGLDAGPLAPVPYSVSQSRPQARLVQAGERPVALPLSAGTTQYHYERIAADPLVSQAIPLCYDAFGHLLWQVSVAYPRRLTAQSDNPYADTPLPAAAWAATFDDQQTRLRLTESRMQVDNQTDPQAWVIGLPLAQRQNALTYAADQSPAAGLTVETLSDPAGLLGATQPRTLLSQQRVHYCTSSDLPGLPDTLFLTHHTETALLTADDMQAYADVMTPAQQQQLLNDGGYHSMPALLGAADEPPVLATDIGFMSYQDATHFWLPVSQTAAMLKDKAGRLPVVSVTRDQYDCAITQGVDACGNATAAVIDYRFLSPWQVTDLNGNCHEVQRDALGRVLATSLYGTELGPDGKSPVNVGFAALTAQPVSATDTVEDAIQAALTINQGSGRMLQASRSVSDLFSWMGQLSEAMLVKAAGGAPQAKVLQQHLQDMGFITAQGHILPRGWRWAHNNAALDGVPDALRQLMLALSRQPIHRVTLNANAWPDTAQQVSMAVTFSDGLGRALQASALVPAGEACQRQADGELAVQDDGALQLQQSDPRWAVTGRVTYNVKGETVRVYQPYFVNDWRYVTDTALCTHGYADMHHYDATGREIQVDTAAGYLRRQTYTPWFTIAEDENDTAGEAPASRINHEVHHA
jgi:hypothetical protein